MDAFSGTVRAVACRGFTVAAVGANASLQQPDPRTGQRRPALHGDPTVKLFDLRTMRQLPPCPFMSPSGPPEALAFHPAYSSTLVAASPRGAVHLFDTRGDGSDTLYLHVRQRRAKLTARQLQHTHTREKP